MIRIIIIIHNDPHWSLRYNIKNSSVQFWLRFKWSFYRIEFSWLVVFCILWLVGIVSSVQLVTTSSDLTNLVAREGQWGLVLFSNIGGGGGGWLVRRIKTVVLQVDVVLSVQLRVELRLLQLLPVDYHVVTVVVLHLGLVGGPGGPDQLVPGDDVDGGGGGGAATPLPTQVLSQVQLLGWDWGRRELAGLVDVLDQGGGTGLGGGARSRRHQDSPGVRGEQRAVQGGGGQGRHDQLRPPVPRPESAPPGSGEPCFCLAMYTITWWSKLVYHLF